MHECISCHSHRRASGSRHRKDSTSIIASWLIQHAQVKAQRLAQDQLRRQEIYKEFIKDAAKLYIDALQSDKADVSSLIGLYAELSNMRVLSSASVVDHADQIVKQILNAYLEPNKTFPELHEMANSGLIDPLRNFSEACRADPSVSISALPPSSLGSAACVIAFGRDTCPQTARMGEECKVRLPY